MSEVYRTLEDGTRVYRSGMKYKPVPAEKRVYKKHKPEEPGWIRIGDDWYPELPLLPDEQRSLPVTRGEDKTFTYRARKRHLMKLRKNSQDPARSSYCPPQSHLHPSESHPPTSETVVVWTSDPEP